LIFGIGGTLYISQEKIPKDGKVLCHSWFKSKVLPGPLTDKCLGGIMHLKPTAGCQISTLIFGFGVNPIHIPRKITEGGQSSLPLGD
jgi:hypothetical protein